MRKWKSCAMPLEKEPLERNLEGFPEGFIFQVSTEPESTSP